MADLSSMSDDDLRAAYAQSDVSSLSDHDLLNEYQKTQNAASPAGSTDEYGTPLPGSSPEADAYLAGSPIGKVLDAVGHGAKQGWGGDEIVHPDTADLLKKAGVFNDVEKGQTSIIRGYSEALLRPAAAGLDLAIRAGGQFMRAGSALAAGALGGVYEAATDVGGEKFGRDVAGIGEKYLIESGSKIPEHIAPLNLDVARSEGVLGTEAQWKGIDAPTEDFPVGSVTRYSGTAEATPGTEGVQPYAATLSPDVQALTTPEPTPPTNVHEAARQIAPDTFNEFDSLAEGRDSLRTQIAASQEALRSQAAAQAPGAAEIADLEARMQDTTPRLAKKYQARLDELRPAHDAFLNDDFTLSALTRDTDEIASMRQQLQEVDYRMRDLAPDVTAAYREAAKQFPEVAEAAPEPTREPSLTPPASEAQERPVAAPEAAGAPVEAAPESVAAAEAPKPTPINIAEDVTRKLVAAGRPAEEADASGTVQDALWRTRAAAFEGRKGTAEEMYAREAPDIRVGRETGRVRQPEFASGAQGKIRLTEDGRSVITLFKSANASTFLHETGHDWLERMVRDAADPDAPARMATDAETVRKYLGNDGGELTTKQHEKFARSFERYFMEGRAPSAGLARVFEQFKSWLTTIYQTVSRLRAPITDDIRDVFDRLLAPTADTPTIARESVVDARELTEHAGPLAQQTPYAPTPKEPKRLISFLRDSTTQFPGTIHETTIPGGLRDVGGDISAIIGGPKGRPGLINKRSGRHLDVATEHAWHAGYFPEHSERPDINHLFDAISEDHSGNPRYSIHDQDAVNAYNDALARNSEIDRLANQHGIDPHGLTRDQFFDKINEKMSIEEAAEELRSLAGGGDAQFDDIDAEMRELVDPPWHGHDEPRTLEELENAYRQEENSRSARQGEEGDVGPGHSGGPALDGESGGGQGGRDVGDERRYGAQAGQPGGGGSGAGEPIRPGGPESVSDGGSEREPELPPIDIKTEPQDFRTKQDREIEKAANIRLDKLNTPDDMSDALRALAQQNGDFMDARYGTPAYQTQMDIRNTRILLRGATSDVMAAAAKAASMDPAAIADLLVKEQRAAMIFGKLSTLSADWAHAGHELNKVMEGWEATKNIANEISKDRELFQKSIADRIKAYLAFKNPEQAAKFASDMQQTRWQRVRSGIISYFINNLISGPITHMAYIVGNTTMALYKAGPETLAQAAIGAIRGGTDRVYFGEAGAQLYGLMRGAGDGIMPAIEAMKTGIPVLPGGAQSEMAVGLAARTQAIPGRLGYVLETPSRVVSGIHTLFYTMAYSQEIARTAFRDAAARGLVASAFDAEVARLTSAPTDAMMEVAEAAATRSVLMKRPDYGSAQYHLSSLINSNIAAKLAMPFLQVGMNILEEGIVQRTPLAVLSSEARAELMGARGGAARDLRMGKIAAGSMLGATAVGLAAEGLMTGGGPVDPNKRRVLEDSGWKAYSIKVGDTYIPYRKFLGPLGPLVAAGADMYEVGHTMHNEDITKAAAAVAFGFSEVVADETWMAGLSNFVEAARNWDTKGEQYIRNLATSFIPFSVGLSQTARLVDPYQRQAQTLLEAARNKIPLASEGLEPRIGIWGQPIGSHQMVSPSTATNDPVDARLQALGIGVTSLERKITGIPLTEPQYTQFAKTAGMLTHQRLTAMVQSPGFSDLPAGIQTKAIQETITKSRETARAMMKMQNPAIIQQATQNKVNLRVDGKGGAY